MSSRDGGFEPQSVARGDEVVDLETRIRLRMEAHRAKLQAHRQKRAQNERWDDVEIPVTTTQSPEEPSPRSEIEKLTNEIARIDDELKNSSVLITPSNTNGTTVSNRQAEAFVDSVFALRNHENLKMSVSDLESSQTSQKTQSSTIADRGAEWLKKREDKIAQMAAKQSEETEDAVKGTPHINAKSRQIASYRRRQEPEVSTRLYDLARQQDKDRKKREAQAARERSQAKPKLYGDKTRRNNAWKGDVADRLYQEAKRRSRRQTALAEQSRQQEALEMREHQNYLRNHSNGTKSRRSTATLIGEDLMRRGEISRLKKQQAREREELRLKLAATQPKTNAVSKKLLKSKRAKGGKPPAKVFDRLYAQSKDQEEKARKRQAAAGKECTFQPHIDEHSRSLAAQNRAKSSIPQDRDGNSIFSPSKTDGAPPTAYRQSSLASRKAQKKLQRLKEEQEEKFRATHTFKPTISHSHLPKTRSQGSSVIDRLQLWQVERDKKLHDQRIQKREAALDGYTFEPTFTTTEYQRQQAAAAEAAGHSLTNSNNPTLRKALNALLELIQKEETERELLEIFRLRDVNGRGQLRMSQFTNVLKEFGLVLSDAQWEALTSALADHNGGVGTSPQHISYEDLGEKALDILCDVFAIPGAAPAADPAGDAADVLNLTEVEQVHPGIEKFIQRQELARAERRRRAVIPHSTGEAWTGRQTIPVSPKFNVRANNSDAAGKGSYALGARAGHRNDQSANGSGYADLARDKRLYDNLFQSTGSKTTALGDDTSRQRGPNPAHGKAQPATTESRSAQNSESGATTDAENVFSKFLTHSSRGQPTVSASDRSRQAKIADVHVSRHGSIDISFLERSTDEILGEEKFEAAQLDRWTENVMKEEAAVHSNVNPTGTSRYSSLRLPSDQAPPPAHVTMLPQSHREQHQRSHEPNVASAHQASGESFPLPPSPDDNQHRHNVPRPPQPREQRPESRQFSPFRPSMSQSERERKTLQKFHERMRKAQKLRKKTR